LVDTGTKLIEWPVGQVLKEAAVDGTRATQSGNATSSNAKFRAVIGSKHQKDYQVN
jgi:hypothetical protein